MLKPFKYLKKGGTSAQTIAYKDVVFDYYVKVIRDKRGNISRRYHTISIGINVEGFLEIEKEGPLERFFKVLHLVKEMEIKNNQGFCKTFYINHRDDKWAKSILYNQEVQNIILQIFEPKEVLWLGIYKNVFEVKLATSGEAELQEEVLNNLIDGMYKLRLKLSEFPSSRKFYDKAEYLSNIYALTSIAIIGFSVALWALSGWIPSLLEYNYCGIQGRFQEVAKKTMLYLVLPLLGFVVLLRGRRPDNVVWLITFAVITPILYFCLMAIAFPFINKLYTKSEITTHAFVKGKKHEYRRKSLDIYYLYLSGWQERGGCFDRVMVSADIYKQANIGDQVAFSIKWGIFDVPYASGFKLVH